MDLNDLSVVLQKPVEAHGRTIEVLQLAEPTGQLVVELGEPFMLTADRGIKELPAVTISYIVKLGKVPRSAALAMAPGDRKAAFLKLLPFLMPGETGEEESE
ncbi:phage tail assembly protein [Stutzerimonas sp. KH-1]|jgi:hypothetical protein